ncbi:bacillithiol biosynthesis deacetylase BshB2 [Paenibacillus faecalis]|uniref:bacillithiol biosynthesis deacetylase BshB2 n=1 Tax=Paenibacillus faecalis TaxID=2079532 RepID=UPI000D106102|nr:bacillithiol biosynthesis deacetylase BshB2 [Paenibacillus faecalis]
MENNILVVLPHPDDESFGASGTLAKRVHEGARVTYACLTLGEMGRNMGNPPFASRITLPAVRKLELAESCRSIGIQDVRMLGFHDKTIEFEPHEVLDGKIKSLIQELKPSLIITFYPGYSVHPDHDATGAAVIRTVRKMPEEKRPVVHCIAFSKNHEQYIGKPDVVNDVSDYIEQKINSIKAHRSQFMDILGEHEQSQDEMIKRFGKETFWTYRFDS